MCSPEACLQGTRASYSFVKAVVALLVVKQIIMTCLDPQELHGVKGWDLLVVFKLRKDRFTLPALPAPVSRRSICVHCVYLLFIFFTFINCRLGHLGIST